MNNITSNNSLESSSTSFPYHSLLFEIQQDQTNQNVASLNTYVQQSNPTYKLVEDEMMKIIRETYEQFPLPTLNKTPFEFFLSRLVELHLISRAKYYNTLTQRVFLKVLSIVKHEYHKDFTEKSQAIGLDYWMKIDPFHLQTFLNTFQINDKINHEEMLPKIRQLKSQNKGVDAVNYIIALNLQNHFDTKELMKMFISASKFKEAAQLAVPDPSFQKLFLDEMTRTRNGSKAIDFLKDFGKDISDFPELLETLQKAALRFHVHIDHWMKVEEKFCAQKHMLAFFIETLINEGKLDTALSITQRNDLVNLGYIKNQHILGILSRYFRPENPKTFNYLDNYLFTKDDYLPSEYILPNSKDTKYAEITDFNLDPSKDIVWIDSCEGEEFKTAEKEILGSDVVGIDTENRFNTIKLENWETSVIQIATRNKIFIFDLLKIGKTPEYLRLQQALLENKEILKLGHSLAGDLKRMREENAKPVLNNHVDLPKLYKVYNPKNKTSLASITEDILDMPLSKIEQLSDWNRRPLRKAQIHYAALDAFILIILYEKLTNALTAQGISMEKFKENMSNGAEDELQKEAKKVKITTQETSEIKPTESLEN